MIDLKTGRFILREGVELYPGMTREDFFQSPLFKTELYHEKDREDLKSPLYVIKTQVIDGISMILIIYFSGYDYIQTIEMAKPEFYDWPDWPSDVSESDYAYAIKKYNDKFLELQMGDSLREGNELWFEYDWGSITSSINLRHTPTVKINIRYNEVPFLEAKGINVGSYLDELLS